MTSSSLPGSHSLCHWEGNHSGACLPRLSITSNHLYLHLEWLAKRWSGWCVCKFTCMCVCWGEGGCACACLCARRRWHRCKQCTKLYQCVQENKQTALNAAHEEPNQSLFFVRPSTRVCIAPKHLRAYSRRESLFILPFHTRSRLTHFFSLTQFLTFFLVRCEIFHARS